MGLHKTLIINPWPLSIFVNFFIYEDHKDFSISRFLLDLLNHTLFLNKSFLSFVDMSIRLLHNYFLT